MRINAYRAVGDSVPLWTAARGGYPTLSIRLIHVVSSGRRIGRAPDGFAAHLRALGEAV